MTILVTMNNHAETTSFSWPLAKAKAHLTELVDAALAGTPQVITRHGEDVVIVIATKQYLQTVGRNESLAQFFARSPLVGVDLAIDRNRSGARKVDL